MHFGLAASNPLVSPGSTLPKDFCSHLNHPKGPVLPLRNTRPERTPSLRPPRFSSRNLGVPTGGGDPGPHHRRRPPGRNRCSSSPETSRTGFGSFFLLQPQGPTQNQDNILNKRVRTEEHRAKAGVHAVWMKNGWIKPKKDQTRTM